MSAILRPQPEGNGAAIAQAPLFAKRDKAKKPVKRGEDSMGSIVTKLAALRERYLAEMQAARERVKKNFLG
jgi:hypothetical protein